MEIDKLILTECAEYQYDGDQGAVTDHSESVGRTVECGNGTSARTHYSLNYHKKYDSTDANAYAEGGNVAEVDGGGGENVSDYIEGIAEAVRAEEYPRKRYEREGHKHREGLGDNRLVLGVKKPRDFFLYRQNARLY